MELEIAKEMGLEKTPDAAGEPSKLEKL